MHKVIKKFWLPPSPALFVGATGGGGGPTPGTVFAASPVLDDDDYNAAASFRILCATNGLVGAGTKLRATITPGSINALSIIAVHIGKWDGSEGGINATTPLLELTFGGSSGFSNKTSPQTSDFVDYTGTFTFTPGTDKLILGYATADNGSAQASQRFNGSAVNADTWFANNTGDASPQTVSGMTKLAGYNYSVASIETSA